MNAYARFADSLPESRSVYDGHDVVGGREPGPESHADPVVAEFLSDGGWTIVTPTNEARDARMTAHRGILHPDEYVDLDLLRRMAEKRLGFTHEEISSVYRSGRLSRAQRELRDRVDARMLALRVAGGNVEQLSRVLGMSRDTIERGIARARIRCHARTARGRGES